MITNRIHNRMHQRGVDRMLMKKYYTEVRANLNLQEMRMRMIQRNEEREKERKVLLDDLWTRGKEGKEIGEGVLRKMMTKLWICSIQK